MSGGTRLQRHSETVRGRRVLVVGVNYWPEDESGVAPYTTLFAEHLAAAGARVTVLTAPPHYPSWRIADGYDFSRRRGRT